MPPLNVLQRFVRPRQSEPSAPRCELCGAVISADDDEHRHLVDLESRSLRCACRMCGLLFESGGAGKYRSVPRRWMHDPAFTLTEAKWGALQIPVRLAFVFFNSTLERWAAFYPGPAGATESLLAMDAWQDLVGQSELARSVQPDVEALLVFDPHRGRGAGAFACHLVPIDACYQLVGGVKQRWRGFDGGDAAWTFLDEWFALLRKRSRPLGNTEIAEKK